jgi:antitoxin VapB
MAVTPQRLVSASRRGAQNPAYRRASHFFDVYILSSHQENFMSGTLKANVLPTRIFKSGNSLSVRIPKEMVPADVPKEAEIEYKGGVWTIRPIHRRKLTDLGAKFRAFSPGFMSGGRLPQDQVERDWQTAEVPEAIKPVKIARSKK